MNKINAIYEYVIEDIPPTNNQFMGKTNFREYQTVKKLWAKMINLLCYPKPDKPIEKAIITLHYYFKDNIRRDPDNYSGKLILDGLVKAEVIKDDTFNNIELRLKSSKDKDNPRTVIIIEEI